MTEKITQISKNLWLSVPKEENNAKIIIKKSLMFDDNLKHMSKAHNNKYS